MGCRTKKSELLENRELHESRRAQAIVSAIQCAVDVRRKYQFFVWTQGSVQTLVPHKLAICGVYDRGRKEVRLEAFNSVVIAQSILGVLTDGQSQLMQYVINAWINNRGAALVVKLSAVSARPIGQSVEALMAAGFVELLVHGVSRPQRAAEIETLFVFASPGGSHGSAEMDGIELMLPHLHSTYLRVQAIERDIAEAGVRPQRDGRGLFEREHQRA